MSSFFVFKEAGNKEEFIRLYADSYYLDKGTVGQIAPNAAGTRKHIEDLMDGILAKGITGKLDIIHILAWKMSKFVQSSNQPDLVYAKDWEGLIGIGEEDIGDSLCVERYGNSFEIGRIAVSVFHALPQLEETAKLSWQALLKKLNALIGGFYGLGPVYLITLMYFISRGTYPIYDQFTMMALTAIHEDVKPGGKIPYKGLPSVKELLENDDPDFGYQRFIDLLNSVFSEEELFRDGKPYRDVDRALWVYGHYFKPQSP